MQFFSDLWEIFSNKPPIENSSRLEETKNSNELFFSVVSFSGEYYVLMVRLGNRAWKYVKETRGDRYDSLRILSRYDQPVLGRFEELKTLAKKYKQNPNLYYEFIAQEDKKYNDARERILNKEKEYRSKTFEI